MAGSSQYRRGESPGTGRESAFLTSRSDCCVELPPRNGRDRPCVATDKERSSDKIESGSFMVRGGIVGLEVGGRASRGEKLALPYARVGCGAREPTESAT